jgi:hypothetical protein
MNPPEDTPLTVMVRENARDASEKMIVDSVTNIIF